MTGYCRLRNIPLTALYGVGTNLINKLTKLGLENLQDVLLHLPTRYEDRTKIFLIRNAPIGKFITIQGIVLDSQISINIHRKSILNCRLQDDSGVLTILFFNGNLAMKKGLCPGKLVTAYGKIYLEKKGARMIHPEYCIHSNRQGNKLLSSLTPIYPTTKGVDQTTLRAITDQALKFLDQTTVSELLPPQLSSGLMSLSEALHNLHRPPTNISISDLKLGLYPAQRRLILEELIAYYLSLLSARTVEKKLLALPLNNKTDLIQCFISSLPFSLTIAQQRAVMEIDQDLARNIPMMRLLQGDVGSGKTLVAALAALRAISNSSQVVLMTPTELLAEQHTKNFCNWFTPLGITVSWLTGKQKGKIREAQLESIASGHVAMVVGTQALFQKKVQFSRLSLVIIDEQHRFGVHQRLTLWEKGSQHGFQPHQLILTATPIPRTLAMTTSCINFDTSVIDELPSGRVPVTTIAITNNRRHEIIQRLEKLCLQDKRQVYWVCTRIEKSTQRELQSVKATWEEIRSYLPELQIGLIHGRMKAQEKQQLMQAFQAGKIRLLVATTVIEVGVDIPNASLIIIENAERLGLAQLHQLRGRVGRAIVASHCVLIYNSPLNKAAQQRIKIIRDSNNGFVIAQHDLDIRGPGKLFGTRQTGQTEFRILDLSRDQALILEVQEFINDIHQHFPEIAQALIKRWIPNHISYRYTQA
ncbi:ATP-dependent DNA helicase RecG [Candidatus Palibaumannia cicadellinicola]|uniref:ATP-dependent DNA helicase RecG n=1 Tax=Baumannia cicadellinicola subsp. Homalodisca coagulata TaxID=374463 RepID=Q1LTY1_BAUCH|nr:ATP-dependent DNA helicase RecG [Candidatus Baumannia cicadellinicola]ABF13995.1 ATP-dependent DNA helicase RecG [Baumannia cicadellinicola str. Hc (Homalodisca coagulata)]MCJ7462434.1 ATP-dependent DNA helicase RecG [Candidatus Baumannia cicadellinicola]MCJ7463034.1 ATP-dependent DNA helicase RecG [Candidatus Baumannia cicadellinicola]